MIDIMMTGLKSIELQTPIKRSWINNYVLEMAFPDGTLITKRSGSFEKLHSTGCDIARKQHAVRANIFWISSMHKFEIVWTLFPDDYFNELEEIKKNAPKFFEKQIVIDGKRIK